MSAAEEMAFGGTDLDDSLDRDAAERRIAELTAGPWWRSCGPAVIAVDAAGRDALVERAGPPRRTSGSS